MLSAIERIRKVLNETLHEEDPNDGIGVAMGVFQPLVKEMFFREAKVGGVGREESKGGSDDAHEGGGSRAAGDLVVPKHLEEVYDNVP